MKLLKNIINEGLAINSKELVNSLLELNSIKTIKKENPNFGFEISLEYKNEKTLNVSYILTNAEKEISITFDINEVLFYFNNTEISTEIINFSVNYFNNKKYLIEVDYEVKLNIKEYLETFEVENIFIIDENLFEEIL